MKVSDAELARLRELPQFYLSQCIAIAGTEPGRRAVVLHKDGTQTWYDDDSKTIEFRDGDEIELIPAAAWTCCSVAQRVMTMSEQLSSNPSDDLRGYCHCDAVPGVKCAPCRAREEIERLRAALNTALRCLQAALGAGWEVKPLPADAIDNQAESGILHGSYSGRHTPQPGEEPPNRPGSFQCNADETSAVKCPAHGDREACLRWLGPQGSLGAHPTASDAICWAEARLSDPAERSCCEGDLRLRNASRVRALLALPQKGDEVLEAVRAGRVTYPPEIQPTGRWMPVEETDDWCHEHGYREHKRGSPACERAAAKANGDPT